MNYVEEVKKIVEGFIEKRSGINAEIKELYKKRDAGEIGAAYIERKLGELKQTLSDLTVEAHQKIISFEEAFKEAAKKASLLNGSMNNEDAVIIQSGIDLTTEQLEDIAERNKDNPFIIALCHKYLKEHPDMTATLPLSIKEVVARFSDYVRIAANIPYEEEGSFTTAMFLDGHCDPEGVELVE